MVFYALSDGNYMCEVWCGDAAATIHFYCAATSKFIMY